MENRDISADVKQSTSTITRYSNIKQRADTINLDALVSQDLQSTQNLLFLVRNEAV
jgi:hypothetical protein